MRARILSMAGAAAFAALAVTASAGANQDVRYTFTMTNPTGIDWSGVVFVIEPDQNALQNDPGYAAAFDGVSFPEITGATGQDIIGKAAAIVFDDFRFDNGSKEVLFEFGANEPFTAADGFVRFQLLVDTPDAGIPFEIRVSPVLVPTPGGLVLAGLGSVALLRRRSS